MLNHPIKYLIAVFLVVCLHSSLYAKVDWSGLKFRNIGMAAVSGRISDIAVDPNNEHLWYATVASGGVWKTTNAGTTWSPIFDGQKSYSIGCITLDPNDSNTIWVGTGENNSQRSVSYGDGVYKSVDGGKTWKNMGLKESEHIGMIRVDPRNSNRVFVAAQGPLWRDGGDRGLYLTEDGGKTWEKVLEISEKTGVNEVHLDPRNPDVIYASSYQRRRHVWTLINGGPESAIYKSVNGGKDWKKLTRGLPSSDKGKIGLAIAPSSPDIIYAIVESVGKSGGVFRSTNAGASFEKRSSYMSGSPQYYNELFVDPSDPHRVFSMDTWFHKSDDGGKNFSRWGNREKHKHVDNHALWINPKNSKHLILGSDGGIYVSYDFGHSWRFINNLPLAQFYRVTVDNAKPFYNIYGGTQDNFTLGVPSRTMDASGITNADVFVVRGGDGFKTQVDPKNPNIVYAQSQYGGLVRFDKTSGDTLDIKPRPKKNEYLTFNWNAALLISPHNHKRLYFGSQKLLRSDDRGESWVAISGDLTRQIDRNQLEVMGRVWGVDTVAKNVSTSPYGTIVAVSESPLVEGLIYVGTDDGLIQVTEQGGAQWRNKEQISGIPKLAYVSDIEASLFDENTVYATFDNHKNGDFKPYVLVSRNRGNSWKRIDKTLPERGSVHAIIQDHVNPELLFVGTEFGVYFTQNEGETWQVLKGGLPTIAVRDLDIQREHNDLVLGTFGRGFYVLDDYSPLRKTITNETLLPVKKALMYAQSRRLGKAGKGYRGDNFYVNKNPNYGATFTYYLPHSLKTLKSIRQEKEAKLRKENKDTPYPSWQALRAEEQEEKPEILLTVTDMEGNLIRRLTGPTSKGFHRVTWDFRLPSYRSISLSGNANKQSGPMVIPGQYQVSLAKRYRGVVTEISQAEVFEVEHMNNLTLLPENRIQVYLFQQKVGKLYMAVLAADDILNKAHTRIKLIKKALKLTPGAKTEWYDNARRLEAQLLDLKHQFYGDTVISKRSEPTIPGIRERVSWPTYSFYSHQGMTKTHQQQYHITAELFESFLKDLRNLVKNDLKNLESNLELIHAPYTSDRFPEWKR